MLRPTHIDSQMRYARPGWRKIWLDGGGDKDPPCLRQVNPPTGLGVWACVAVW